MGYRKKNNKVLQEYEATLPLVTDMPIRTLGYWHGRAMKQLKTVNFIFSDRAPLLRKITGQYSKNIQCTGCVKGAGLCDLKTQYAKKKRNPE